MKHLKIIIIDLNIQSLFVKINHNIFLKLASILAASFIAFGWFYFTARYSVNILFSDAWDFHRVFIKEYSVFKQFIFQFGPQRLGPGLILTGWLNELSGWNAKWISICSAMLIFISGLVYLQIKKKHFGKLNPFDLIIFVLVLSLNQFEILIITPFLSHSPMPALLVSVFCLSFFIRPLMLRNFVLIIINLNLVYSSFGFFMGLLTVFILLVEAFYFLRNSDKRNFRISLIFVLLAILTMGLFFVDYNSSYTKDHVLILWDKPWRYLIYISLSYAGLFGVKSIGYLQIVFGGVIFSTVCYVFLRSVNLLVAKKSTDHKHEILNKIVIILTGYSLLFAINLAFGRLKMGLEFAGSSRYLPYLVPSLIGVYLYISSLDLSLKSLLIPVFFVLIMFLQFSSVKSIAEMNAWYTMKTTWKMNFLKYENAELADSLSNFKVYPHNRQIEDVLLYLKTNKLNLYLDKAELAQPFK